MAGTFDFPPDPDGAGPLAAPVTTQQYDLQGNLLRQIDPLGRVTQSTYQGAALIGVSQTNTEGGTNTLARLTYTASGQAAVSVDAAGRATTYGYDALGSRTSVTQPDPDGPGPLTSPVTRFRYDALGRLTQATDPLGHTTQYAYADYGRQVTVTLPDPDGAGPLAAPIVQYQFDAAGNLLSETDPLGRRTSYSYDALGRLATAVLADPDGDGPLTSQTATYTYTYVKVGNLVTETDALGQTTHYTYDARNRLVSVTLPDPDGDGPLAAPVATYTYDAASQVIAQTDPTGNVTRYEYDALGRQIKVTQDPDGDAPQPEAVTTNVYDIAGRLVAVTDPLGHTTQFTYDDFDRATAITDANGGVTQMAYDGAGNLVSLTDPAGNTTTWTYDALNRVTGETNELGTSRSFQYDAAGQQTRRTDRNGRVTVYAYDALGRMASESRYDSVSDADAGQYASNIIHYQYDAAGRLVAEWDNYSSSGYTYDALDRVTTETVANPGAPVVVFTTGYDRPDALRTSFSATIDGAADFQRTYQYDALGQMTHIGQTGQPNGNAVAAIDIDLRYDAAGRFAGLDRYLGTSLVATSTWQYDARGNLTALTHSGSPPSALDSPPLLAAYTWSFDAAGRLIGAASPDGTVLYTYDATGQLTRADYSAGAGLPTEPPDETYAYDANGNRTTVAAGGSTAAYITGPNNQVLFDGTYWYAYDPEGNRTARHIWMDLDEDGQVDVGERSQITEYAWDNRNRLVSVTDFVTDGGSATQVVTYTYDTHNRWISRMFDSDGAGQEVIQATQFVYDGNQIILTFVDLDGSGSQPSTLSSRLFWGPAVDQILADEQFSASASSPASRVLFPLTDHLGTVRDVAELNDATGVTAIVNHRVFDAYGQMTAQSDAAVDFLFGFTGRSYDEATGLQNNWNRWYDPDVGQWLSQDPKGFMAGDGNLHRYVSNQVSNATDPTGLDFPVFSDRGWEAYGRWAAQRGQRTASTKTVLHLHDEVTAKTDKPAPGTTPWWIKTNTGKIYSGSGSVELLEGLKRIDREGQKIKTMILKGHGTTEAITDGFFSSTYLINVMCDSAAHLIQIPNSEGTMEVVTPLLKRITDSGTYVSIRACTSEGLAKNVSALLPEVTVQGAAGPALSVPGSYQAIFFPREYRNGNELWSAPDPGRMWPNGSKPGACFVAGTLVACPHGFRPIEQIRPGDTVLTWDPCKKSLLHTRVTKQDVHEGRYDLLTIGFSTGDTVQVTPDHPFYHNGSWVESQELARIANAVGALNGVMNVRAATLSSGEDTTVFNLQTEAGTYLVGRAGLLVSGRVGPGGVGADSVARRGSQCARSGVGRQRRMIAARSATTATIGSRRRRQSGAIFVNRDRRREHGYQC